MKFKLFKINANISVFWKKNQKKIVEEDKIVYLQFISSATFFVADDMKRVPKGRNDI